MTGTRVRSLLLAFAMALIGPTLGTLALDAEAARLGKGRPAGMQRQLPPQKPADATPTNGGAQANPGTPAMAQTPGAAGAATAASGKRSWMGPVAGLAAGLGLAALASHLGFGEGLANLLTLALFAMVLVMAVRWLMRRFASPQPALAGASHGVRFDTGAALPGSTAGRTAPPSVAPGASKPSLDGFDAEAFERVAKLMFIRMQAANDAADIEDLRRFTTPELFASIKLDLQERGSAGQQTDVVQLHAAVADLAREDGLQIATVRFHGLIREVAQDGAQPFDELWHLVRPEDGSREWAVAGIAPIQ